MACGSMKRRWNTALRLLGQRFINEVADGGAIILQKAVEVQNGDTPEILQKRVMEQAEWEILPKAVSLFCDGKIKIQAGKAVVIE